jgi:hypothetical protein
MTTTRPTKTNATKTTGRPADPPAAADPWRANGGRDEDGRAASRRQPLPDVPRYNLTFVDPAPGNTYPLILVEGPEYTGKSSLAVRLGLDPRIGQTWVLPVGEEVDWLHDIAPFQKVAHNGQWWQIISAVEQMHALAAEIRQAGDPPPLLVVDSGTKVWELLTNWAEFRAASSEKQRVKRALDPNCEVDITHTYWNAAKRRHQRLVHLLRTMPAVVVITARGRWVTAFDDRGQPVNGSKVYSVQAEKDLGYATKAWVRLSPDRHPQIVGARLAVGGIRPGVDEPLIVDPRMDRFAGFESLQRDGFNLSWLLDVLRFDPATAAPAQVVEPAADADPDPDLPTAAAVVALPDADEAPGQDSGEETHPAT